MGRPIKKTKMSGGANDFGGNLSGNIAVTAYRPDGGSKVDSTVAYIVNQRGSQKFKLHLEDSSEAVYCLQAVAPGSLPSAAPNGSAGTFCVQIILDDSTVAYVSKFFNNTVHYVTAGGVVGNAKYQLNTEATDEAKVSGIANIDVR
tara:strand:+ start:427 stop:864 length:438 start_codon:yes stop_codon:yes gene_type:complete